MKLKFSRTHLLLESAAVALLLLSWLYLAIRWESLPESVPSHYNFAGVADAWSGTRSLWLSPTISLLLYALVTVIGFFPKLWNVPGRVTEQNRTRVYGHLRTAIQWLKLAVCAIFAYMTLCSANAWPLGGWFFPLVGAGVAAALGIPLYRAVKATQGSTFSARR